ncbi:MAG: sigma-70 family RNA polymerase sigma factor [Clostridia bacterium]|nr:sigma-70 family RNA polymerase sigma factor [Clostridia bacterium]
MVFETIGQFMSKLMFFHGFVNEHSGFPGPLSKEEETECIKRMHEGDQQAREKLIDHNLRLIVHIAKKYTGSLEAEELLSVGSIGLIKAIDSYQEDKGSSISTYASRCIENEILMLLRANKKHKVCVSIEESIGEGHDGSLLTLKDIIPQDEEKDTDVIVEKKVMANEAVEIMKKELSERDFKIMALRYGFVDGIDHSQQEVADIMGISRSYISRIETHALQILKEKL